MDSSTIFCSSFLGGLRILLRVAESQACGCCSSPIRCCSSGLHQSGMVSRMREGIVPHYSALLSTASRVLRTGLGPPAQERCKAFGKGLKKAMEMIRGLEHLSYEDRLDACNLN